MTSVLPAIEAIFAWLGADAVYELAAERISLVLRPVMRPIWRTVVMARWPWPLLIVLPLGVASMLEAYALLSSPTHADAGLGMFFAGAGVCILTLVLWTETRREARITRGSASQSVGVRS